MNKILKLIYDGYETMPINENPLETPKLNNMYSNFFDTYFGHFPINEYDNALQKFFYIISAYQEQAFETGFYAGIEIMKEQEHDI